MCTQILKGEMRSVYLICIIIFDDDNNNHIHTGYLLHGLWSQTTWILILALPFVSCVILGKLHYLCLSFFHLKNGDDDNTMI